MARSPEDEAKGERDVWKEVAKGISERLMTKAVPNVEEMLDSERPWEDRTVGDVASLEVVRLAVGVMKAREQVKAIVPVALPVLQIPLRIQDESKWEQFAAEVHRTGKLIEAEVVEPPKEEK